MAAVKLTLSVDKDTVLLAKEFAAENNISVSKLFKNFVIEATKKKKKEKTDPLLERLKKYEIPEEIKALSGILKGKYPDDMNYKDMKYEYLKDKHGL